jgi:hypothetical protein
MATVEKDFKVKNGLIVSNGGVFGGTVEVGTPTLANHATTKEYVDGLAGMTVSDTAPSSPSDGTLWLDTISSRIHVYLNSEWIAIATMADAAVLQDHIHDTSIDGNGFIVSVIVEGGFYNSAGALTDAGTYDLTSWNALWDGGLAVDNFN